jgi:hypothetical protein
MDCESGLYYLRARYYDPANGQFTSVDPLVGETQMPYAYVSGDPINEVDSTGLSGCGRTLFCDAESAVTAAVSAVSSVGHNYTFGICISGSIGVIVGITGTGCIAANLNGIGVTGSFGAGADFPGGADVSIGPLLSNAHSYKDLSGLFDYGEASLGDGPIVSAEVGAGTDSCRRNVNYLYADAGVGFQFPLPVSVSGGSTNTWTAGWSW